MADILEETLRRLRPKQMDIDETRIPVERYRPANEILGITPRKSNIIATDPRGVGTFQAAPRVNALLKENVADVPMEPLQDKSIVGYPQMMLMPSEQVEDYQKEIAPNLEQRRSDILGRRQQQADVLDYIKGRDKLYEDTLQNVLTGITKYKPTIDYAGEMQKLQGEEQAIKEPEESSMAQMILHLAPALFGLVDYNTAAAAPKAYEAGQETYNKALETSRKSNELRRKAIATKIEALSKAQANDVVQFSEQQKSELDRYKTALNALDKESTVNRSYYLDENKALNQMEKDLNADVMESAKEKLSASTKEREEEIRAQAKKELADARMLWDKEKAAKKEEMDKLNYELNKAKEERAKATSEADINLKNARIDSIQGSLDLANRRFEDSQKRFNDEYGLKMKDFLAKLDEKEKDRDWKMKLQDSDNAARAARMNSENDFKKMMSEMETKNKAYLDELRAKYAADLEKQKAGGRVVLEEKKAELRPPPQMKMGKPKAGPVAPKEGEVVPGYIWNGTTKIEKSEGPKLREAKADKDNIDSLLRGVINKVKNNSYLDVTNPFSATHKSIMADLRDAQLAYKGKSFAELGVLTGPDERILDQVIEKPKILGTLTGGGKDELVNRYESALKRIQTKFDSSMSARGLSPVGRKAAPSGGSSRDEMIQRLKQKGYR